MTVKRDILENVLEEHGFKPRSMEEVETGKFNTTFVVLLAESPEGVSADKVVLRIAPGDDSGFVFYEEKMMDREPVIHNQVRTCTDIPIPEIYVYDDSQVHLNRSLLIMEYMPGSPLSEVRLPPEKRKKAMEETGHYLGKLHARCSGSCFGYPSGPEKKPQFTGWPEAFFSMWERLISDIEDCGVYTPGEAGRARDTLRAHAGAFPEREKASLLHMDIWAQNILVDSCGGVTAILDWDRALWGDPEIEFAVLDYCGFNNPHFWRGYGASPPEGKEAEIRARFYHLYEVQKYLVIWTLRGGQKDRIIRYRDYALGLLSGELAAR